MTIPRLFLGLMVLAAIATYVAYFFGGKWWAVGVGSVSFPLAFAITGYLVIKVTKLIKDITGQS